MNKFLILFALITVGSCCKIEFRKDRQETIEVPVGKNPSVYALKPIKEKLFSFKNTIEVYITMDFFEGSSRTITLPRKVPLKHLDYYLDGLRDDPIAAVRFFSLTDGTPKGLLLTVEHQGTLQRYGHDVVCMERVMDMIACMRIGLTEMMKTKCKELYKNPNQQQL